MAIEVSSSSVPCLPQYADAQGHLVSDPVYRSSAQWGTVFVGDREIVPGTLYEVRSRVAEGNPLLSSPATATTRIWGDATGDSISNVLDILCVLDGFQNVFGQCTRYGDDLQGASYAPDGVIDIWDITAVLDGFAGVTYSDPGLCSKSLAGGEKTRTGRHCRAEPVARLHAGLPRRPRLGGRVRE